MNRLLDWLVFTWPVNLLVRMLERIQWRRTRMFVQAFGYSKEEARSVMGLNDAEAKSRPY